ncbi:coth protein-domain-containing protein [Radiomyces spectabilis]|uniref:coth protein-domain-containing protein n=1 Tax=Radiomyces spectabilis TaxID=64574 RepID=UPI00221F1E91|nr:coth protein-domain-containing protein [Radiomyces spectabilis]KAI8369366.1 coth protein-domain-containing protein [Radiomyces spectabilis]
MKQTIALGAISFFMLCVNAANVTFKVIAPGSKTVQVSVNGVTTNLKATDPDVPYFVGEADLSGDAKYKYVADGKSESFDRALDQGRSSTRNDFFGREVTYANIPDLPHPIPDHPWTREGNEDAPMWDSNYIPSIFITGDSSDMEHLVKNVSKKKYPAKFTFIGPDQVHVFENISFGLHKPGKKKNNSKQTWVWQLNGDDHLYNRNWFKIRHMEEDPTQMREKLYADILHSLGTYANRANMVRFFINGEGFGTFNMLDDVIMYSYINAMFYDGKPPKQMGALYDGSTGADFQYWTSDDDNYWSFIPAEGSPKDPSGLVPLTKAFNQTNTKDDAQIQKFSEMFDVDQFLRFMVVEYLTADWDGYWYMQTNDGAYQDPNDNKWYYLGQDFDATFGVNLPDGRDYVKKSYKEFPKMYPGAVLINRLLENQKLQNNFETYLKNTVEILFNNVTLTNRILKYHNFIAPDLKWDRSIKQQSPGIDFGWTYDQTSENLWHGVASPKGTGGGAGWGLVEWIIAKSDAVAKEFHLKIVDKPVIPAKNETNKQDNNTSSASQTVSAAGVATPAASGSAHVGKNQADTSADANTATPSNSMAAGLALPQLLSTVAIVAASFGISSLF